MTETSCGVCAWEALSDVVTYLEEAKKRGIEIPEIKEVLEVREKVKRLAFSPLEVIGISSFEGGISEREKIFKLEDKSNSMVLEALNAAYRWLEPYTGLSAEDLNLSLTPELLGTAVGDVVYDATFRKVGSALMNLLTGALMKVGLVVAKDYMTPFDRKFLSEISDHFITRVFRLASPGDFSLALREVRDLGVAFGAKRYEDVLRGLIKTPETLSATFDEIKAGIEELSKLITPVPTPAPAPAPTPTPAPAPVTEVL
jgi:hypothetical protein